ncbi:MAG: hypothetical protein R2752_05755 [Vicinamibacterales bacterium]
MAAAVVLGSAPIEGQLPQNPPPVGMPPPPPNGVTVYSSETPFERQQKLETFIRSEAERFATEVGDRLKAVTLGIMNPEAGLAVRRWSVATWRWTREKPRQAGAFLSLGVLEDCLGRMQVVQTPTVILEESRPFWPDQVAARPGAAAKNFEKALEIDPSLAEARFRQARIRAARDKRALADLETMASEPAEAPFGYLAAISRAEEARSRRDTPGAVRWYERARELQPRSMAAAIGLASLGTPARLAFDELDPDDVYYTYPCVVLTPDVAPRLEARIRQVVYK